MRNPADFRSTQFAHRRNYALLNPKPKRADEKQRTHVLTTSLTLLGLVLRFIKDLNQQTATQLAKVDRSTGYTNSMQPHLRQKSCETDHLGS